MNKLLTKIVGAALGLTMTVGVGVAVANNQKVEAVHAAIPSGNELLFTINFKDNGSDATSALTTSNFYTNGVTSVTDKNSNNVTSTFSTAGVASTNKTYPGTGGLKCGSNKNAADFSLNIPSAYQEKFTYVVINCTNATRSITITAGGGSDTLASGNSSFGNHELNVASTSKATTLDVSIASASKTAAYIASIAVYKTASTPAQTYTVSFNANGGTGSMSNVTGVSGSYTLPSCGFTAPSGKTFSGWKANNAGDLIAVGGSYTVSANVTFYAQWVNAYTVTYTAGTNGSGSYAHASQPAGTYTLLPFASLTGVSASSGYKFSSYTVGGVEKNPGDTITLSAATAVTVNFEVKPLETTYVFATNYATYASSWSTTYGSKTINGKTDVGGDYAATIYFERANKQSSGVGSDKPYICGNTNADAKMITFTLTESGYKIKDVEVVFETRGTNYPAMKLFKGDTNSGTALDSGTIGTKNTLSATNLNDTVFTVTLNAGGTSNKGCAVTSIYISIEQQASFGTLDHITITGLPTVVYHVGETYDPTGLTVIAYDGADESTANFKDVSDSVETDLDNPTPFADGDVPGFDCDVQYTGDGGSDTKSFHVYVYALAEYELVTSEPADWSGEYLIVASHTVDEVTTHYAMNGALSSIDVEGNHKIVSPDGNDVVEDGQELEWTIASYSTGYSIRGKSGKYIGWASGSGNGLTASDTALVNTISISGSDVTIAGTGERHLTFNSDGEGRFRYYTSGSVQLYKLVESDDVSDYADLFLDTLTGASGVCHYDEGTGEVTTVLSELKVAWKTLADAYSLLSHADQEQFRLGVGSSDPGASNVARALYLYDHIATAYGTQLESEGLDNYNFMNRSITPLHGQVVTISNSGTAAIIAIVSVITLSAVAGYFMLRKRKEQ